MRQNETLQTNKMDESSRRCNNHDIIMHHEIYDLEIYQLATMNC